MSKSPDTTKLQTKPIWIDTRDGLKQLLAKLTAEKVIAVDTESDSLYSYFEKVCLIQFSTPQTDYLLDPLNVDISPLADLFATPSVEKIFHAAEYDILSLKRDYNFTFVNLFDTMLAARILGWKRYGLGSILADQFEVKLDKRFQRYNWGQRPLSQQALDYARLDTHYLLRLRRVQIDALKQQNRLREAYEAFERQTQVEPTPKNFNPDDFWRVKGCKDLAPQEQAVLRELFILRDKIARKIDRPPFKVVNDAVLVRLAQTQPHSYKALKGVKGVGPNLLRYNGNDIVNAIEEGKQAPPPQYQPNNNHRPDEDTMARYESLRQWRNKLAAERGVEPDVIMSNETLMNIARRNPKKLKTLTRLKSLGDWQAETYGQAVMQVLRDTA
jgi:ribonuclease D